MSIDDQDALSHPTPASGPKCAWATLLTSEHLLPGVVVFAHSLLSSPHASRYPLVIMATSKLSSRARSILSSMLPSGRVIIRDIEPIYPTSIATQLANARFNEVWTKLRAFDLTEYDRVGLVDSDMLVRKNMDELFEDPFVFGGKGGEGEWIGASWACTCNPAKIATYPANWVPENCGFTPQTLPSAASCSDIPQPDASTPRPGKLINSGLVILTPNSSTMAEMIEVISTDPRIVEYRFPDQDFLADFFTPSNSNRHIRYLPYKYNALKKLRIAHPNIWRDEEATNIHYILDKPWVLGRPGGSANPEGKDVDAEIHSWWWGAWDEVKERVKKGGGGKKGGLKIAAEDWQECVEKYVTLD